MRGRLAKPLEMHILNGNPSRINIKKRESYSVKPDRSIPECPAHLDDIAVAEWKRMSPILYNLGLLTDIDATAFASYCQLYSRWVKIERKLSKEKLVNSKGKQNPLISASKQTLQLLRGYITEFGMTPSARSRMAIASEKNMNDPMEKLLNS